MTTEPGRRCQPADLDVRRSCNADRGHLYRIQAGGLYRLFENNRTRKIPAYHRSGAPEF